MRINRPSKRDIEEGRAIVECQFCEKPITPSEAQYARDKIGYFHAICFIENIERKIKNYTTKHSNAKSKTKNYKSV